MKNRLYALSVVFILLISWFASQAQEKQVEKIMKPAILVIDIQNKYLTYMDEKDTKNNLEMINWAILIFRQHGYPVIRVYHTDPNWGPDPDSEDFQFPSTIQIQDDDIQIIKNFPNAFKKTELEKVLKERNCNTLFLCGLSAVGCVLATYQDGLNRDYNVFMLKDALISHNSIYTDMVEDISETVSLQTLQFMLEHMKK